MNNIYMDDVKRLKIKRVKQERELIETNGYTIVYKRIKQEKDGLFRYVVSVFHRDYHFGTFNITSEGGLELLTDIRCLLSNMNRVK